jgi:hypothetical protein
MRYCVTQISIWESQISLYQKYRKLCRDRNLNDRNLHFLSDQNFSKIVQVFNHSGFLSNQNFSKRVHEIETFLKFFLYTNDFMNFIGKLIFVHAIEFWPRNKLEFWSLELFWKNFSWTEQLRALVFITWLDFRSFNPQSLC